MVSIGGGNRRWFWLAAALCLGACATVPSVLEQSETELGLATQPLLQTDIRIYHSVLLDPSAIRLKMPGYIVGIEKLHDPWGRREVTHIVRYRHENAAPYESADDTCLVHSDLLPEGVPKLGAPAAAGPARFIGFCDGLDAGAEKLANLRGQIKRDIDSGRFSHVLVMVMGWNTDQAKAVRNFNALTANLALADPTHGFRPLVVGITWPSLWQAPDWSTVPDALVAAASFWTKKEQSESVGRDFVADIVRDVAAARDASAHKPKLVLIGHSFGARALVSSFWRWKGGGSDGAPATGMPLLAAADRIFLLGGAFQFRELFNGEGRFLLKDSAVRVVLTASRFDEAVSAARWGHYAGRIETYALACGGGAWDDLYLKDTLGCAEAHSPGQWGLEQCGKVADADRVASARPMAGTQLRYFDASKLINCHQFATGGGAHSDIFRQETGRFLMAEILAE